MIKSFSIKNFKSFREATLPLAPLTLLIDANASGKSDRREVPDDSLTNLHPCEGSTLGSGSWGES